MVCPWRSERSEARFFDVPAQSLHSFQLFLAKHSGPGERFLDCQLQVSGQVRLGHNSQADVARYVLNYMNRDFRYDKLARNCQYFACDLFALLVGKPRVEPFSQFLRPLYVPRVHTMLYDPQLFQLPPLDPPSRKPKPKASGSR